MRLIATHARHRGGTEGRSSAGQVWRVAIARIGGEEVASTTKVGVLPVTSAGGTEQRMDVGWYLGDIQRDRLRAHHLPQGQPIAHVGSGAAAEVRQGKVGLPVAAVGRAQQREQRLILIDRQKLPVALCPAFGGKVERNYLNLCKEWCGHKKALFSGLFKNDQPYFLSCFVTMTQGTSTSEVCDAKENEVMC